MIIGQFVMVLIMAMTPLHIRHIGLGLGAVGFVISAHTLGMFAMSPLTGWLVDRLGPVQIIVAGIGLLAGSAVLAAVAPADGRTQLALALFLLGLGLLVGVFGSVALALLLDARDRPLVTPDEIEASLELPTLVSIPRFKRRQLTPNGRK